jgi:three-Cys-motif partner protein
MTRRSDPNPTYWEQYGPFQHVKHELIRCYLNGWYPKLGTWAGRVLYVDTHAGRGRYDSGDPGSPVLALQTLLRHSYREKLLQASEFNFLFIERDPANLAALEAELSHLKPIPARINVETSEGDASSVCPSSSTSSAVTVLGWHRRSCLSTRTDSRSLRGCLVT